LGLKQGATKAARPPPNAFSILSRIVGVETLKSM